MKFRAVSLERGESLYNRLAREKVAKAEPRRRRRRREGGRKKKKEEQVADLKNRTSQKG